MTLHDDTHRTPLDRWGPADRLPAELAALLDPKRELPEHVRYWAELPQPALLGIATLPFAGIFALAAVALGPLRLILGEQMSSSQVLGALSFSALLCVPAAALFWRWRREVVDYAIYQTGKWRRGVFVLPDHLVVHFGGSEAVMVVARDRCTRATIPVAEDGVALPRVIVSFVRDADTPAQVALDETMIPSRADLHAYLERWIPAGGGEEE